MSEKQAWTRKGDHEYFPLGAGAFIKREFREPGSNVPSLCDECNLPIPICNGIAMQRKAIEAARRGNMEEALRLMTDVEEFFADYDTQRKAVVAGA